MLHLRPDLLPAALIVADVVEDQELEAAGPLGTPVAERQRLAEAWGSLRDT
jgi:hypothetical protein